MKSLLAILERVVLSLLGLPLFILLLPIILPFCVLAYGDLYLRAFNVSIRMWLQGRVVDKARFNELREYGAGTLIVDNPTLGWPLTRIWWTQESKDQLPAPEGRESKDFVKIGNDPAEIALFESFTNYENGRAILLATRFRASSAERMLARFSKCELVRTWSGAVLAARRIGPE